MKLVVGTGNPGRQYAGTRHNVGFMIVREVARRARITLRQRRFRSLLGEGRIGGQPVALLEPHTYVNLMGEAVALALGSYGIGRQDLLVVVDDVNLPLGQLRLRRTGSSGGHNGLESVETALESRDYPRLRFGLGPSAPGGDLADFVLEPFSEAEAALLPPAIDRAADAVRCWAAEGITAAMNRFNAREEDTGEKKQAD